MPARMHPPPRWLTGWLLVFALVCRGVSPGESAEQAWRSPFDPRGLPGALTLCGAEVAPEMVASRLDREASAAPLLVAIGPEAAVEQLRAVAAGAERGQLLWGASVRGLELPQPPPPQPRRTVWCHAAVPLAPDANVRLQAWLQDCLSRGHDVVLSGGAVALTDDRSRQEAGVSLLPGCVRLPDVSPDEDASGSEAPPPGLVGWRLASRGILQIRGRRILAAGESDVAATVWLAAGHGLPAMPIEIRRDAPADLTTLRRAAALRQLAPFPPVEGSAPEVPRGTLLIVGGGGFTPDMVQLFVDRAGGQEARIVVIPTAEERPRLNDRGDFRRFLDAGAGRVDVVHCADASRTLGEDDLKPLVDATGVWFGGGRQWRFIDAYEGTPFVTLCHAVLARGGVIGGSSAGATIQGEYLVRGHPLGNTVMMAEGYERGFGFLPGAAIDQHFTQRNRAADLQGVKRAHPQLVCLGVDESTALEVSGSRGRVIGAGTVSVYDRRPAEAPDDPERWLEPVVLASGEVYDFSTRSIVTPDGMN